MKTTSLFSKSRIITTVFAIFASALLLTHAGASAVSTAMTAAEEKAKAQEMLKATKEEVQRRIQTLKTANEELKTVTSLDAALKNKMIKENESIIASLDEFAKKLDNVKTLGAARELAASLDSEYEKYKNAAAKSQLSTNLDTQQDAKGQLTQQAKDVGTKIDDAAASGKETGNLKEQLQQIEQMLTSITAIIASVSALMESLVNGDYGKAMIILNTIFDQLGITQSLLKDSQGGLSSMLKQMNTSFDLKAGA